MTTFTFLSKACLNCSNLLCLHQKTIWFLPILLPTTSSHAKILLFRFCSLSDILLNKYSSTSFRSERLLFFIRSVISGSRLHFYLISLTHFTHSSTTTYEY